MSPDKELFFSKIEPNILEQQSVQSSLQDNTGTRASDIAHDLNNLLMNIQGHVSLMLMEVDPSHAFYGTLTAIEQKIQSGSELTAELHRFSQNRRRGSTANLRQHGGVILHIENNSFVLDICAKMLHKLGFQVTKATGAEEGLRLFKDQAKQIEIVLLDVPRPGAMWEKVYNSFKKIKPEVKVLLTSGYNLNEKAAWLLELGCHGFLQKPFDIYELSEKIGRIIPESDQKFECRAEN